METPRPEDVQVAAGSLAWTMLHFRELLDDDAYAAVLPHFQVLADAVAVVDEAPVLPSSTNPRDPEVIAAAASA